MNTDSNMCMGRFEGKNEDQDLNFIGHETRLSNKGLVLVNHKAVFEKSRNWF